MTHTGTTFMVDLIRNYGNVHVVNLQDMSDADHLPTFDYCGCEHLLIYGHTDYPILRLPIISGIFEDIIISTFRHPYLTLKSFFIRHDRKINVKRIERQRYLWFKMLESYDVHLINIDLLSQISCYDRLIIMQNKMPLPLNSKQIDIILKWKPIHCALERFPDFEFNSEDKKEIMEIVDNSGIIDRLATITKYDFNPYKNFPSE